MAACLTATPFARAAPRSLPLLQNCKRSVRSGHICVVAKAQQQPEQPRAFPGLALILQRLGRYDFLSTGLGAATVTSFCVARGQDPFFALWLTFCATIAALAVNELLHAMEEE